MDPGGNVADLTISRGFRHTVVKSVWVGALKRPKMGAEAPLEGASAPCVVGHSVTFG
jgi:hypothetical protein